MNQEILTTSINWGLVQLKAEQNPDGSFTSATREFCRGTLVGTHDRRTTFYSSAITLALQNCSSLVAEEIRGQAVSFLLHEAGPNYEYRYWSQKQTSLPDYPPDLDDTLLALAAIHSVDERLITGRCLAWLLHHLITGEKKPDGPYRTWLFTPNSRAAWSDIDGVVNANIYYSLQKLGIAAPSLAEFCRTLIQEQRWHSPYYIGIWPTLYSLARLNIWEPEDTNWSSIWQEFIHSPNNALSQALVLSSALRTGYTDVPALRKLAGKLIKACADGNNELDNCAYIMERHGVDTTELSGARGWTLATVIEALELFRQHFFPPCKVMTNSAAESCYQNILNQVTQRFNEFPEPLQNKATTALNCIKSLDKHQEIGLSAYYANEYLGSPLAPNVVEKLGYINMLGWLAYQVYDDWLDEDTSQYPLALAQLAWRTVGSEYTKICRGQVPLDDWVKKILDQVDVSNALEKITDPPTDTGHSTKSIGHAIGVGVVFALGSKARNSVLDSVAQFFTHYLTAKQLCDDMHDWEDDLLNNRPTPVIQSLLKQYQLEHPEWNTGDIVGQLPELRRTYWKHTMPTILIQASDHITSAAAWCRDLPWEKKPAFFLNGLQQVQTAIQQCRNEFVKTTEFITTYATITA